MLTVAMLILVRHGESVANAQGLLLGRTDAELTESGREQAAAARGLLTAPVAEVRSSPLSRARDTAALLALGPPVTVDERWVEVDYGEFECQPLGGIPAEVWQRGGTTATSARRAARRWPRWTRGSPPPARSCSPPTGQVPVAVMATWWW